MTDVSERAGRRSHDQARVWLDPESSQRWARTVAACDSCGEPVYRRAGSKDWLHRLTHLKYSNHGGSHLAHPRPLA